MNRRTGFTLVEVTVVLLIMGVVAAVAAPSIMRSPRTELDESVVRVRELMTPARRTATQRGLLVQVTLHPTTRHYVVVAVAGDSIEPLERGTLALPSGAAISGAAIGRDERPIVWQFAPIGGAAASSIRITMGRRTRVLVADRWTGEIADRGPDGQ